MLADGNGDSSLDQLGEVPVGCVIGDPTHWNGFPCRLAPRGQGDVQQLGCLGGVVIEQLIEITHPIKHKRMFVLRFDAEILLHHGRMVGLAHGEIFTGKGSKRSKALPGLHRCSRENRWKPV